ncbi:MAG: hypothetical protein HFH74_15925 [Lachnospiraceae bacterium]|jgi:hypothetical protein|nr:hypothetical protein [Lachnospiraceae bacterium]
MNNQQKGMILTLLKIDEMNGNYTNNYWFSYKDFLDPTDEFTDFSCERLDGKQRYVTLIENLLRIDESAKVFVQVYGLEDNEEQYIYADTLIIFSKQPFIEIKQIFNEPEDIFPSDIGEEIVFSQPTFLIDTNGDLISSAKLYHDAYSVYYCWWD